MTSPSEAVDTIEKALEGVKKEADGHYCRALDQFQKTPCLGAEYKMENGLFGMVEHEAHAGANKTMGHHFGMYEAIRLLEPAIAEVLALARKAEAMESEMAEKDAEIERLRRVAADRSYMMQAYRNMLGPKGLDVAEMWERQGVTRHHTTWGPEAIALTGEERAQALLDVFSAKSEPLDFLDSNALTVNVRAIGGDNA